MSHTQRKHINLEDWYTLDEAVEKLSENAGRPIDRNYPRSLARYRKVRTLEIGAGKLYRKKDIDAYVVSESRGPRAKHQQKHVA